MSDKLKRAALEFSVTKGIFNFCGLLHGARIHIDTGVSLFPESTIPSAWSSLE
jgi:hypothetical protein